MQNIIIFCQAPADIQYALTIYERNKNHVRISVFCINVEGMYKFIESLNLNLEELVFIPYDFNFYYLKPIQIIKVKRKLALLKTKYFDNIKNRKIYFFSHFFDYMTFFFVSKLCSNNNINFINHYDNAIKKNYNRPQKKIKLFITKNIYQFITGINFKFYAFNNSIILEFTFKDYGIKEIKENILDDNIHSKYTYNVEVNNSKNILLLETDFQKVNNYINYIKTTKQVMQILKQIGYSIYLKPHPRIGYSRFLDDYIDSIVNADVPAEFINENQFDLVIGIGSSGLAYFANRKKIKVISLMNIYQYYDENTKKRAFEYINDLSSNVRFIKNLDEFKNEIQ